MPPRNEARDQQIEGEGKQLKEQPELQGARLTDQSREDLARIFAGPSAEQQRELMAPFRGKTGDDVQIFAKDSQGKESVVADGNTAAALDAATKASRAGMGANDIYYAVRGNMTPDNPERASEIAARASFAAGVDTSPTGETERDPQKQAAEAGRLASA
ncbi:MAG: hypothetical protein HY711_05575 [Candidatus Melainabacteria bacterium]|nr:hypothetical protein [Candidatus Melainabacteria bacterium]